MSSDDWPSIWRELRDNLTDLPNCSEHPEHPCVYTLSQNVPNDVLNVVPQGVLVRSHRSEKEDFIEAERFRRWWAHLCEKGTASTRTSHPNNPDPLRSSVVGAIFAQALPERVVPRGSNEIERSQ